MTNTRRQLPVTPSSDNLRKQAKARLAAMRMHSPSARLGEAQLVLAREYGFPNWAALQAEAAQRAASPAGAFRRIRSAPLGILPFWRGADAEPDENPLGFLRGGIVMSAGVLLALLGLGIVLMTVHQGWPLGRAVTAHHHQAS